MSSHFGIGQNNYFKAVILNRMPDEKNPVNILPGEHQCNIQNGPGIGIDGSSTFEYKSKKPENRENNLKFYIDSKRVKIAPGDSGGPVLDDKGFVIGLNESGGK